MDSANAISAPARTPGMMIGRVILRKVTQGFAPRSAAASSSDRSKPVSRARTVTATYAMLNATCASSRVTKPRARLTVTNSPSSEAPSTISEAGRPVPHQRQRQQGADQRREYGARDRQPDRQPERGREPRDVAPLPVPLQREPVPGEAHLGQARGDPVEAVEDHHPNGQDQVGNDQPGIDGQEEPRPPAAP